MPFADPKLLKDAREWTYLNEKIDLFETIQSNTALSSILNLSLPCSCSCQLFREMHALLLSIGTFVLLRVSFVCSWSQINLDDGTNYLVLLLSTEGMANRLRSMADWYSLASSSNRTLLATWQPTSDCNASFSDLFDVDAMELENFRILPFSIPSDGENGNLLVSKLAENTGLSYHVIMRQPSFMLDEEDLLKLNSRDISVVITSFQGVLSSPRINCQQYLERRHLFYSKLVPIPLIRNIIDDMKKEYFTDRKMVGIHVRIHDEVHDWEVVPPLMDSNKAVQFGSGATMHDFTVIMRDILNKQTSSRIFLASNNPEVKAELLKQFGEDVIVLNGELSRSTSGGMQFALLEWYALAQSDLIVHTYGSTFAEEASFVNRKSLVGIWHSYNIFTLDTRLPFCGHMQYTKHLASNGVSYTYNEGTKDARDIDDTYFSLGFCNYLDDWGISKLYCNIEG